MADVVPQRQRGSVANVFDDAHRCRVQRQIAAEFAGLTNRSGCEDPQEMPVREDDADGRWTGVHIVQERVDSRRDIGDGLPARTTIPDGPVVIVLADLRRRQTLVVAVVELAKSRIDRVRRATQNDLCSLPRPRQRTRPTGDKGLPDEGADLSTSGRSLGATVLGQGDVGASGVATVGAPLRRPVADKDQLHRAKVAACVKPFLVDVDIEAAIRRVPAWSRGGIAIRPLSGGITNRNYIVAFDGDEYVVRIPGERTQLLGIDRKFEAQAAVRAAAMGIGPPVFGELPGIGTQITQFIPGRHLDEAEFVSCLDEIVDLIKRFHESGPLDGQFPIHRVVEWHARDASSHGAIPPAAYERLHQQSRHIELAFAASPTERVPCHNDLLPSNVLRDDGQSGTHDPGRIWLLDYEYAGMNDVFFDLANLSSSNGFNDGVDERLLTRYFGAVTASRWARLQLMKAMSEFREGMWAVVQQAISSLDKDFVTYADQHLRRCEQMVASPEFGRWLSDARGDPQIGQR